MDATVQQEEPKTGLSVWQHGAIFLLAYVAIISRRPDAVLYAQFRIEDGAVFFADAYNLGPWAAFFRPWTGYFMTLARLGAALSVLVPLSMAPLVLNIIAIAVQALPVNLLLIPRSSAWGGLRYRAILAGFYLALPNCWDINANITSSQWPLALSAFLVLVATTPRTTAGRFFDLFIISLSGLSGPFCIFLLPIAAILAWKHRDRWQWAMASVLAATCFVQIWSLLNGGFSSRPHYSIGASPVMLTRLLAGQLYLGTLLGSNSLGVRGGLWATIVFTGIAAGGTILVILCFLRSSLPMKLFLLFSSMLLAASLISATLGPLSGVTAWEALATGCGARYWFFPTLAFGWTILWCIQSPTLVLKTVSSILLCVMLFGIALRWRHPAYLDMHFTKYVKEFEAAPVGTAFTIPENPAGAALTLVKRSSNR